ncbi:MAG: hypothetical protein HOK98_11090 [Rhodospirillaceae bacterium]|jgi:hypothetical protein|nr:hypothetical protein [Rhodospirillaceae bacterium]MBT5944775.1 hypothetical protein [Rhodospirillaceae bacterium]MBT6404456.1 hypothetical protein [Rhodospirillaceae bacterium]MBT6536718.1 hypothetical protein [Rhodospirillaceae bacterium]MBT7362765.1 hypothetical protein [Rhodospirillaceae bacterium]
MSNSGQRLVDQPVTVRVLAKVLATLAAIALSGWWFMFDEVRLVRGDVAQQGSELAREIDGSARFQLEQRDRLWNRVDALREEIHVVQLELGDLRARLQQVGQTADAIFAVVSPSVRQSTIHDRRPEEDGVPSPD